MYSNFEARPGNKRGASQPVGAVSFEPYGRRFSIEVGNRVTWLGWSLYVGYLPHYGPRYMDVRFKGERIAYEISMQEALACKWGACKRLGFYKLFGWRGVASRGRGLRMRSVCRRHLHVSGVVVGC
jgi:primary-amine oxidase